MNIGHLQRQREVNPEIITLSEEGSIQETLWDAMDRQDTKIQSSEHPQKGDVNIQPGMKSMGSSGPWLDGWDTSVTWN